MTINIRYEFNNNSNWYICGNITRDLVVDVTRRAKKKKKNTYLKGYCRDISRYATILEVGVPWRISGKSTLRLRGAEKKKFGREKNFRLEAHPCWSYTAVSCSYEVRTPLSVVPGNCQYPKACHSLRNPNKGGKYKWVSMLRGPHSGPFRSSKTQFLGYIPSCKVSDIEFIVKLSLKLTSHRRPFLRITIEREHKRELQNLQIL